MILNKKIILAIFIFTIQYSFAQQFTENTDVTIQGIIYGEVSWINTDNNDKNELLVSGYDDDYNNFSGIYSLQSENLGLLPINMERFSYSNIGKLDYNQDGFTDFIINGYNATDTEDVILYISNGFGSFTEQNLSIPGTSTGKMKVEDLNNDGLSDLIITGVSPDYAYIAKLYIQDTNGYFIESTTPFFGNSYGNILTFDANNDGNLDVLLTGFSNNYIPETKLYFNDGNAVFTESTSSTIENIYFSTSSAADFDNDGDMDLLISGYNSSYAPFTALYDNDSEGLFTLNTQSNLSQLYWGTSDFVDYDNDGDLDLFITGADSNTIPYTKFYSNTNGVFNEDTVASSGVFGTYISSSDWIDYDNDGDLDFVLSGLNADSNAKTKVYVNQQKELSVAGFTTPVASLILYPNPTTNRKINLVYDENKLHANKTEIVVYSSTGQKVFETILNENTGFYNKSIDLPSLSNGIYLLQFSSGNFLATKKLIIK